MKIFKGDKIRLLDSPLGGHRGESFAWEEYMKHGYVTVEKVIGDCVVLIQTDDVLEYFDIENVCLLHPESTGITLASYEEYPYDVNTSGDFGKGYKDTTGKVEWSQVPWEQMEEVAWVLTEGAKDHGSDTNWQHVKDSKKAYFNSMMRHIIQWKMGEVFNRTDHGRHHLAHAISNALFLMWGDKENK